MKNNKKKLIVLISLIVCIGLIVIGIINFSASGKIIKDNILNITKLTSMSIYSEINIELIKPIFVSLTMANDQFLKDWIMIENEQNIDKIKDYLTGIKDKYNYDSVFYVSNITNNYYHYDGILKQISNEDEHDVWYTDFLATNKDYGLIIDTDQAAKNSLTFFVNCKISDPDGNVLGVTGTGVEMSRLSQIFSEYKEELGVDVFLVDGHGAVQIYADENYIGKYNIFEEQDIASYKQDIVGEKEQMQIFELQKNGNEEYLVSRYIEELDWYLIVKKDTGILQDMLKRQLISDLAVFAIVFIIIMFISGKVISHFQNKVNKLASTDMLTELKNRRMFDDYLKKAIDSGDRKKEPLTLIIFDIDNFKAINDTYGHVVGDDVIKAVADSTNSFIRTEDMLARWGGDEFAIVFHCDVDSGKKVVYRIQNAYKENKTLSDYNITASFGMTTLKESDTVDSVLKRADTALYWAKADGKNKVHSD